VKAKLTGSIRRRSLRKGQGKDVEQMEREATKKENDKGDRKQGRLDSNQHGLEYVY
jgi:hypothetical protein